jgi:hypothetical protein
MNNNAISTIKPPAGHFINLLNAIHNTLELSTGERYCITLHRHGDRPNSVVSIGNYEIRGPIEIYDVGAYPKINGRYKNIQDASDIINFGSVVGVKDIIQIDKNSPFLYINTHVIGKYRFLD